MDRYLLLDALADAAGDDAHIVRVDDRGLGRIGDVGFRERADQLRRLQAEGQAHGAIDELQLAVAILDEDPVFGALRDRAQQLVAVTQRFFGEVSAPVFDRDGAEHDDERDHGEARRECRGDEGKDRAPRRLGAGAGDLLGHMRSQPRDDAADAIHGLAPGVRGHDVAVGLKAIDGPLDDGHFFIDQRPQLGQTLGECKVIGSEAGEHGHRRGVGGLRALVRRQIRRPSGQQIAALPGFRVEQGRLKALERVLRQTECFELLRRSVQVPEVDKENRTGEDRNGECRQKQRAQPARQRRVRHGRRVWAIDGDYEALSHAKPLSDRRPPADGYPCTLPIFHAFLT